MSARWTLGIAYDSGGQFAKAESAFDASLEVADRIDGSESVQAADTLVQMAALRSDEGVPREGITLAEHAFAIDKRLLSPTDAHTLRAQFQLAELAVKLGDYTKADSLLARAIQVQTGKPELLEDLSNSINEMSITQSYLGNTDRSIALQEQGLAIDRKLLGDRHPDIAEHLMSLANGHALLGEYAEAEPEAREALSILADWFPAGHHETASAWGMLGYDLAYEGKFEEAKKDLDEALKTFSTEKERSTGEALALLSLGVVYEKQGRNEAALQQNKKGLAIYQALYAKATPASSAPLRGIASVSLAMGKKPEAEQAARRAYDLLRNLPSPGDLRRLRSEVLLGKVLHAEKKDREAAPLLKAAVANAKAVGPRISGIQQQAQSALAELDKESAP